MRAEAPAPPASVLDDRERSAAFAAGSPRIPRRVIAIGAAALCVLALGGTLLERLASSGGLNPPASATGSGGLTASMPSFLGAVRLNGSPAPGFVLVDQHGRATSLAAQRGKVVVLSFFSSRCDDACRVLESELARADALLGRRAADVVELTVNTDPLATSRGSIGPAVTESALSARANWRFLTGATTTLNSVWRHYGVAINVYRQPALVVHNNVMYFIDPRGRLRWRTTPVVNQDQRGAYSLPADLVGRSAAGIAAYAGRLLGRPS